MIIFPAYIALIWTGVWLFRRRWQAYALLAAGLLPIGAITELCVQLFPLGGSALAGGPGWLYPTAGLYSIIFLAGGIVIACQRTRPPALLGCARCGYELAGLPQPICPECGVAFADPIPEAPRGNDRRELAEPTRPALGDRVERYMKNRQGKAISEAG